MNRVLDTVREYQRYIRKGKSTEESYSVLAKLSTRIRQEKLDEMITFSGYKENEAYGIGSLIEMANHYHLQFAIGTCYGDCRAVLNKEYWLYPISDKVPATAYGTFYEIVFSEIANITGFGNTIELAIMRCLLNARIAGVI